jgi:hypothetical protein
LAQTSNDAVVTNPHENAMDYSEHDKTYGWFLLMVKWGVISNVILLVAMAVGFFGGWGLIGGALLFIVLHIVAFVAL